ncbi:alpha/beta hydrolase fold domain-containing protein [Streptomyces coeruleorubidus]|uniref:alpha/beta hydrolase fold domain-containing protein n=1 Tax=Streptomyces coeruleorubidus TaxID=116188 RepID=UPI00364639AB
MEQARLLREAAAPSHRRRACDSLPRGDVRLTGLPPAFIATAEFAPLCDEGITYALRLLQAGLSVELHQWPDTFHGSLAVMSADVSQRQPAELGCPAGTDRRAVHPRARKVGPRPPMGQETAAAEEPPTATNAVDLMSGIAGQHRSSPRRPGAGVAGADSSSTFPMTASRPSSGGGAGPVGGSDDVEGGGR